MAITLETEIAFVYSEAETSLVDHPPNDFPRTSGRFGMSPTSQQSRRQFPAQAGSGGRLSGLGAER
jgi:hypothetical protein